LRDHLRGLIQTMDMNERQAAENFYPGTYWGTWDWHYSYFNNILYIPLLNIVIWPPRIYGSVEVLLKLSVHIRIGKGEYKFNFALSLRVQLQ
jgi:hypothetical protein